MAAREVLESAQRFPSGPRAASELASRVSEVIDFAVRARGRASLLVPGGQTPVAVFKALRTQPLPWDRVYISLTDERRVPMTDDASNARLIQTHLLQDHAAEAHFCPIHRESIDDRADEAACGAALGMLPRPFDAVILGMGADGHIASLFPDDPNLARMLDPRNEARCATARAPAEPVRRLTLTFSTLLQSRWMALHISGEDKWATLEAAVASADPHQYPVYALLNQRQVPVRVYWSP